MTPIKIAFDKKFNNKKKFTKLILFQFIFITNCFVYLFLI